MNEKNRLKKIPVLLITFFLGIFILNITAQWFGFLVSFTSGFTLSLLFSFSNLIYWQAKKAAKANLQNITKEIYPETPSTNPVL